MHVMFYCMRKAFVAVALVTHSMKTRLVAIGIAKWVQYILKGKKQSYKLRVVVAAIFEDGGRQAFISMKTLSMNHGRNLTFLPLHVTYGMHGLCMKPFAYIKA